MQSSAGAAPPTLQESAGMPDDVRRWLEHLQKTEQARIVLATSQVQDAARTLTGLQASDITNALDEDAADEQSQKRQHNDRAQQIGTDMASMQQAWRTLERTFDSVPAPADCVATKAYYDQVIGRTGAMIVDIVTQIRASSDNPQAAVDALTAMQGQSRSQIDVPARAADQNVASICRKYDVVKWFDIQSDVGSGSMAQLGF